MGIELGVISDDPITINNGIHVETYNLEKRQHYHSNSTEVEHCLFLVKARVCNGPFQLQRFLPYGRLRHQF